MCKKIPKREKNKRREHYRVKERYKREREKHTHHWIYPTN